MKRLYLKIYLTIIVSLLLVVLVGGTIWRLGVDRSPLHETLETAAELVAAHLPPQTASREAQQRAIADLSRRLGADVALFDASRRPIAQAGRPLPPPPPHGQSGTFLFGPGGPAWAAQLPDGRWIVARAPPRHRHPALGLVLVLGGVALAVGLCAYPVVRGLTRRLERLQHGVETLGAGQLSARVKVEGRDEVARLAESFNRSAGRIEELVNAHRLLLANASHELRTPLSRLRLAVELFQKTGDAKYKADLERDINELDALVDEILLQSRLDVTKTLQTAEEIDVLALAAEECAHYDDCLAQGEPVIIKGDARLLRRLIRNLLENAHRHGKPPVRIEVQRSPEQAIIDVIDSGSGIPETESEHVFTPFYRLATEQTGTGLGLSLARQIARLHDGDIAVVTRPDAASCFRVSLPV
ncbi:MAG: HAMP domain-containing sensor histidine kinase [Pseudorhodoplanes sp.]|jgi:signal transduction histidine kinase|nr:HAMP domain-containing sensor histidine kinase [Pseudorhodoplanes sp.]